MDQAVTCPAAARLAEIGRAHPEFGICQVESTWHAFVPRDGSMYAGTEMHGRDEGELLAKLTAAGLG